MDLRPEASVCASVMASAVMISMSGDHVSFILDLSPNMCPTHLFLDSGHGLNDFAIP